jgi:hypothetical protein
MAIALGVPTWVRVPVSSATYNTVDAPTVANREGVIRIVMALSKAFW